jgi:hypothetical protein
MVVIVPVDRDVDEAQDVAEEHRQQRPKHADFASVWCPQFEHHDGDDDGDDAVTERLEPGFTHGSKLSAIDGQRSFPAHALGETDHRGEARPCTKPRTTATYQFSPEVHSGLNTR